MSELSKQAGMLSGTEFFRFFVKSIIGIALARLISPAELGSYRQLFLIYTTLSTILLLGIPQSLLYFLPRSSSFEEQKRLISRTLNIVAALAIVCQVVIILSRLFIADKFHNPALASLLLVFGFYPLFIFVTQLYSSIMLGMKQPLAAAKFTIFAIGTDFILILGTALFTKSVKLIVWAVLVSSFLQWLYVSINLRHFVAKSSRGLFVGFQSQLNYCIPLGLSSIIGILGVQLDKFMISGFFTPEQFAIFSVGAMELPFIGILANSVNSILLPQLSSNNVEAMSELYKGAVRKNALIVFPMAALFYIFAEPIIIFLYGIQYSEASLYFRIYLMVLPLRIATYGIIFQAFGKTKAILINALFMLSANAVMNYFFIQAMGMKGAAYATVLVTWLSVGLYLVLMKSSLHLKLREFFPFSKVLRTAIVTLLASAACIPFSRAFSMDLLNMFVGGTVFMMVYYTAGRLLGAILPYDVELGRSFVKDALSKVFK